MNQNGNQPQTFSDALETMSAEEMNQIMNMPVEDVMARFGGANGADPNGSAPAGGDPPSGDAPEWKQYIDQVAAQTAGNVNKLVDSLNQVNGRVAGIESAVNGMPSMVSDIMRGINEGASAEELQQRTQRHQEAQQSQASQQSQAASIQSQVDSMIDSLQSQFTDEMQGDSDYDNFRNHWSRARQALNAQDGVTGLLALTQASSEFNSVMLQKERAKMQADFEAQREQIKKEVMQEVQPENLSMPGTDGGDDANNPLARLARLGTDERVEVPNDEALVGLVLRDIGVGI